MSFPDLRLRTVSIAGHHQKRNFSQGNLGSCKTMVEELKLANLFQVTMVGVFLTDLTELTAQWDMF